MEDTVPDICVSYDGTWMKRGHMSRIGIGCVIDVMTGLVLDAELLSTYCHMCETTGTWVKGNTPQRYDAWYDEHRADCCINYASTSGNMEVVAAELLWARSVDNHWLRYTSMLSDGDAKAFVKVQQLGIYPVTKEECINHVSKRMDTSLRNVVADCSKRNIPLGGRGTGRLTKETMDKLQTYYD
ncbi:hypothetical protein PoB_004387200 [Plakobranchus ocellatus]|uniref:Mutator-like transposase domain-containing protein n=1 Tax=Plakobranchus ocellatus TaxID=259542 RepID=A0AAV4BDV6_9GAST|nr:hypothetical protein PoB_004387200 [Plakobranchus ocellatus]